MAKHMCEFNGCHNVIDKGRYCEEHGFSKTRIKGKQKQRSIYHHDNKPIYRSDKWQSVCLLVDMREHNKCQRCGQYVYGRHKHHHHIIPIKQDPTLQFEPNNIMLLCSKCHPIVEHEQETDKPKVYPSYFSPPYQ